MSRPTVQFNDYISLAVLALMFAAFLGGQPTASASDNGPASNVRAVEDHFRGEDE